MLGLLKIIVSKLGGIDTSERNHVDEFTENKMLNVSDEQIAFSENGGIWIKFQELSDFHFMNVVVIGTKRMKTFDGCDLYFISQNSEFKIVSDTKEIESDFSNVSDRWITNISFEITNENIEEEIEKAISLKIVSKNYNEIFQVLKQSK